MMVITVLHSDRRPRHVLIQRQRAVARELQTGNQRAGYGHATARRASGLRATNRREEGQRSEQLVHTSDRVADLPERRRPGTIGIRLVWHTQRYQAGPQQFGDVADPAVIVCRRSPVPHPNTSRPSWGRRSSQSAAARTCARLTNRCHSASASSSAVPVIARTKPPTD
jgi:hypothetical protein